MRKTIILAVLLVVAGVVLLLANRPSPLDNLENRPTSDDDFAATISTTDKPLVFDVAIEKINPKVDKQIVVGWCAIGCRIEDSKGKTLESGKDYGIKRDAEPPGSPEFVTSLTRRITLHPLNMPPGRYTVTPDARILEVGKDAVHSARADFGTVDVPAGNSVKVRVR